MTPQLGFAALLAVSLALSAQIAAAQDVGPIDGRVGGPVVRPDDTQSRRSSAYTSSRDGCFKDGRPVSRSYCDELPAETPYARPNYDSAVRCLPGYGTYDAGSRTYTGYDGVRRNCQ